MPEAACRILKTAGGPIDVMKLPGTTAGSAGAVTPVRVSTSTGTITVANAPYDKYEVIIEIMITGTLGAGTFRYSLDDGNSYSAEYVIPTGGVFDIPDTNIELTFVPGAGPIFFEDGDIHWFDCVAPHYDTTDVADMVTALLADPGEFAYIVFTGWETSAANAATLFAAIDTHMVSFANAFRHIRAIMSAGNDTEANVATSFAALSSTNGRIAVMHGTVDLISGKPIEGWVKPAIQTSISLAARAARCLISEDPGRFASGALVGASNPSHDEALSPSLDQHRIGTVMTYPKTAGIFITNAWLKSAAGSDYRYWQHGRAMDVACDEVYQQQQWFIASEPRTNSDGTIFELDARAFEDKVIEGLRNKLVRPKNKSGKPGHVSDLSYTIDRTIDLLSTETIESNMAARPLGYPKVIETTLGFSKVV